MLTAIAMLVVGKFAHDVDKTTLLFYQDTFVVRKGRSVVRMPLRPETPAPVASVEYRSDANYAVWDDRGLTIRYGKHSISTRLPLIAVSPRAFSRPEIRETLSLIKDGKRTKDADAISGSRRIGRNAYFLVRWDDSDGRPWAEALVRVDLDAPKPQPQLIGRLSLGAKSIDDRMMIVGGKLAILGRNGKDWSVDTYDPKTEQFASDRLGDTLVSFAPDGPRSGIFVEQTPYGTSRSGLVDLIDGTRTCLAECPGFTRFIDSHRPSVLVQRRPTEVDAVNAETGAMIPIAPESGIRRLNSYVVVWSPAERPTRAILYSPDRWEAIASWQSKTVSLGGH
jgi:hypothetical protein